MVQKDYLVDIRATQYTLEEAKEIISQTLERLSDMGVWSFTFLEEIELEEDVYSFEITISHEHESLYFDAPLSEYFEDVQISML